MFRKCETCYGCPQVERALLTKGVADEIRQEALVDARRVMEREESLGELEAGQSLELQMAIIESQQSQNQSKIFIGRSINESLAISDSVDETAIASGGRMVECAGPKPIKLGSFTLFTVCGSQEKSGGLDTFANFVEIAFGDRKSKLEKRIESDPYFKEEIDSYFQGIVNPDAVTQVKG